MDNELSQFDFEALIEDSVKHILEHGDPQVYLRWLQLSLIRYQHDYHSELTHDRRMQVMLSSTIGRMIWNATPLPDNGYEPHPLPKPQRNSFCICGSGKKYKHCCAGMPQLPPLSKTDIWPLVLAQLKPAKFKQAMSSGHIPLESLFATADDFIDDGKLRRALDIFEPQLQDVKKNNSADHEYAFNQICNLYDELGYNNKKQKLIDRITTSAGRSPLRSGAYQRLATIAMDSFDPQLAWQYYNQALQDDPEAISLSILEVQLLLAENKTDQAKQRAQFWLKKFQKLDIPEDEYFMGFLTQAAKDPGKAFLDVHMDLINASGENLVPLLIDINDRPCPQYTVKNLMEHESANEDEPLLDIPDAASETVPGMPAMDDAIELIPSDDIQKIEQRWAEKFNFEKPFSTQDTPFSELDPWELVDQWVEFLETHPAAFDSLDILDDIATALTQHEMNDHPWHDEHLLKPVLLRAVFIINKNLDNIKTPHLSWLLQDNRPALRSMARLIGFYLRNNNSKDAFQLMKKIVLFNPADNHGFRSLLANEYLMRAENENCLQLAANYPDDINPEIVFGEVLALYRQARLGDAQKALCTAIITYPKLVPMLIANKVKKPKIDNMMVSFGGDDQAWIYRHEMREEWLSTEDAMKWLKKTSALCQY